MKNLFIILGLAMMSLSAHAASYNCTESVNHLALGPDGSLWFGSANFNMARLCQIGASTIIVNGQGGVTVSSEACKAIYATLMSAKLTGKQIMLWFNDDKTCSTHTPWVALSGWYFGPDLVP